jgi:hypothetical protein
MRSRNGKMSLKWCATLDAGRCESGWNSSADRLEGPMPVGWLAMEIEEEGAEFVYFILDVCTGEDCRDCGRRQSSK